MFKCVFCGLHSPSGKARYCSECGPDGPSKNWQPEEIDRPDRVAQYASALSEYYFDAKDDAAVAKFSLLRRERLKISHDTHKDLLTRFAIQKNAIAHLSNFRLEFNENVTDAYAGHDTFLNFRYTNLSEDYLFKVSLVWRDPESMGSLVVKAQTKGFVKPQMTATLGYSTVYERMGFKVMADLLVNVADEFGESANFSVSPFNFNVGSHEQRVTHNISTHNQISIEGRGVIDASGMGADVTGSRSDNSKEPKWNELDFAFLPQNQQPTVPIHTESPASPGLGNDGLNKPSELQATEQEKADLFSIVMAGTQGDSDAQYKLGKLYELIYDLEGRYPSDHQAEDWYNKSAVQGNSLAQIRLWELYTHGDTAVVADAEKSYYWLPIVAEGGHAEAQDVLARHYQYGGSDVCVLPDMKQAVFWFEKAAEANNLVVEYNLGWLYENESLVQDFDKALIWYRRSADQGFRYAQYRLGHMWELGKGREKNIDEAVFWYKKAAQQGNEEAESSLRRLKVWE